MQVAIFHFYLSKNSEVVPGSGEFFFTPSISVKVNQSRYRPEGSERVPGS